MISMVVIVRRLRPLVINLGMIIWLVHRFVRFYTSNDDSWTKDPSILQLLIQTIENLKKSLLTFIETTVLEYDLMMIPSSSSSSSSSSLSIVITAITFLFQLFHDALGILALLGMCRVIFVFYHHFSLLDIKHNVEDSAFEWAKEHLTSIQKVLADETKKMEPDMRKSLKKSNYDNNKLLAIPTTGRDAEPLLQELDEISSNEHESSWKTGKISGTVYTSDEKHIDFMNRVYSLYSIANTLHPGVWPRLNQCEAELVSMTSALLHGTGIGCTTSGGTESIMLAIKAHWQYYGKRRGIVHPELICGSSAHAAVDKACEVLGIRKIVIDCNDGKLFTLNPKLVRRHITCNTIMIYASAPSYPQGTIDPIEELGIIAQYYNIGLHVDACLGGFVLPFITQEQQDSTTKFPKFDFQVPGVTSMSADTHKFGYAPKGTSIVLYRDNALRHAQYFCYAQWTGGMYATPTFAGSRPSALVACAWASLVTIGMDGYQQRTKQILEASRRIAIGINDKIPELKVLGQQCPSMIVCFASADSNTSKTKNNNNKSKGKGKSSGVDVYRVADAMTARGWSLNSLQHPPSVHVCVTLALAPRAKAFLQDLQEAVEEVKKEDPSNSKKGTAGMYGMTGSIPEGPVNDFLRTFIDLMLTA